MTSRRLETGTGTGRYACFLHLHPALHKAILGIDKNEVVFAQKEVIDALLDMLGMSPQIHRSMNLRHTRRRASVQ